MAAVSGLGLAGGPAKKYGTFAAKQAAVSDTGIGSAAGTVTVLAVGAADKAAVGSAAGSVTVQASSGGAVFARSRWRWRY